MGKSGDTGDWILTECAHASLVVLSPRKCRIRISDCRLHEQRADSCIRLLRSLRRYCRSSRKPMPLPWQARWQRLFRPCRVRSSYCAASAGRQHQCCRGGWPHGLQRQPTARVSWSWLPTDFQHRERVPWMLGLDPKVRQRQARERHRPNLRQDLRP